MGSECYKLVELSTLLKEPPRNGLYKSKEFQGSGHRWIKMSSIFGSDFFLSHETELLRAGRSAIWKNIFSPRWSRQMPFGR